MLIGSFNPADGTKAAELYEDFIARVLGSDKVSRSSAHFNNPTNPAYNESGDNFVFSWITAATRSDSIEVSRAMWAKASQWAWGDRPMLALRFYGSQGIATSSTLDLAVVGLLTLTEMVDRIEQLSQELEIERAATKRLAREMRLAEVSVATNGSSPDLANPIATSNEGITS